MQEDIIGITDEAYNKIVEYEYDSWGNIITIKDNNGNIITDESHIGIINPFRYRSYYYDKETKLYYLNSRYYNPEWGRFINCDSLIKAEENKYNLYMYCKNNSIKYSDHLGTMGGAPAGLMPGMLGGAISGLEAAVTGLFAAAKGAVAAALSYALPFIIPIAIIGISYEGCKVEYIGRTGNIDSAIARHGANPFRSHLSFRTLEGPMDYDMSRVREQYYIKQNE